MISLVTQIVVGHDVVAEWDGPPPNKGEQVDVMRATPQVHGDPFMRAVRGVVGHRQWIGGRNRNGAEIAVCACYLEDVTED